MGNSDSKPKSNKYEFDKINRTIDSFTSDCTIEDTEYINKLKLKKRKKLNDIKNIENKVLINSIYIALNFQNYKKNKEVYEQFPPNISLYNSLINNNNLKDDFKFTEQYIFLNKLLDNEEINLRLSNLNNLSYNDNSINKSINNKNDNNNIIIDNDEETNNENNLSDFLNVEREKIKEKKKSKFNKKFNNNLHINNNDEDENDIVNKYNLKVSKILINNNNNNNNNNNFDDNDNIFKNEKNKNKNNKILKTVNNINDNNNIDDNMIKFQNKFKNVQKRENSNDKPIPRNPFIISKFNNNNKINQSNTPDNKYKFRPKNLNRKTLNNNNNFNNNKDNYRKTEGNKNRKKSPLIASANIRNSKIKNKNDINNINESNIIKIDIRDALNKLKQMKIISSDDLQ